MKKLEYGSMESLQGGKFGDFVNGFCGGIGAASSVMALTGVGVPAAVTALAVGGLACGVMSLFR